MEDRVLIVDDDPNLLSSLRRQLIDHFDLTLAQGGKEALLAVQRAQEAQAPFAVVVCDMQMPELDGIQTLRRIQDIAPETVLLMLTGNADQKTAIDAINQGNVLRFYTKPCPMDTLVSGIKSGIEQYKIRIFERELLENTLAGSVKMLIDLISVNNYFSAGLSVRIRDYVRRLYSDGSFPRRWQLEIAASLALIGHVAIPPDLVAKKRNGEAFSEAERKIIAHAPETARNLIANIPRLGKVAEAILLQDRGYDGSGFPEDGPTGEDIPVDARMLKILKDLAEVTVESGATETDAFVILEARSGRYDPKMLIKIKDCLSKSVLPEETSAVEMPVSELRAGQIVLSDLRLTNGLLIFPARTKLEKDQIDRIGDLQKLFSFVEPIKARKTM